MSATKFTGPNGGGGFQVGTGFTGNLTGDVTGSQGATVVSTVGGASAASVAAAANAVNTAILSSFSAGTAATLPVIGSIAQLTFGTTSPGITIATAGSYLLRSIVNLQYSGATYAANQTATIKLRRTNNTAADIANATFTLELRIITTITDTAGIVVIEVPYTAGAGDVIQVWGAVSALPAVGNVIAASAQLIGIST